MLSALGFIQTGGTDPYTNIALEAYLLETVAPDEMILYLWQNARTVVIGRNQNHARECRLAELQADGGHLARRLSGGGAVFHDLGNLNFTFLAHRAEYSVQRQLRVILGALEQLGIRAEQTGRNDLTIAGAKFSGNAFYHKAERRYHHGTLLVDVDKEDMGRYLNPSPAKLRSKGVASVKARVANLVEFRQDLTIEMMSDVLGSAFAAEYGLTPRELDVAGFDAGRIAELTGFFASDDWLFGKEMAHSTLVLEDRFEWGDIHIRLHVDDGVIQDARVFSDAMDVTLVDALHAALPGQALTGAELARTVDALGRSSAAAAMMAADIRELFLRLADQ